MQSIRQLHEAADAALNTYLDAENGGLADPLDVHEAKLAYWRTRDAMMTETRVLRDTAAHYDQTPGTKQYDALIAAALQAHATDMEVQP